MLTLLSYFISSIVALCFFAALADTLWLWFTFKPEPESGLLINTRKFFGFVVNPIQIHIPWFMFWIVFTCKWIVVYYVGFFKSFLSYHFCVSFFLLLPITWRDHWSLFAWVELMFWAWYLPLMFCAHHSNWTYFTIGKFVCIVLRQETFFGGATESAYALLVYFVFKVKWLKQFFSCCKTLTHDHNSFKETCQFFALDAVTIDNNFTPPRLSAPSQHPYNDNGQRKRGQVKIYQQLLELEEGKNAVTDIEWNELWIAHADSEKRSAIRYILIGLQVVRDFVNSVFT